MANGDCALYRMPDTATPATLESAISDRIEISGNARVPDGRTGLVRFVPNIPRRKSELDQAFSNTTDRQDTGSKSSSLTIDLFFDETDGGTAGAVARLRDWATQDNDRRGVFQTGLIGWRCDRMPEFNVHPGSGGGLKIDYIQWDYEPNKHRKTARVVLLLSGDQGRFGQGAP